LKKLPVCRAGTGREWEIGIEDGRWKIVGQQSIVNFQFSIVNLFGRGLLGSKDKNAKCKMQSTISER